MKSYSIHILLFLIAGFLLIGSELANQVKAQSLLENKPKMDWVGSITYSPLGGGINMRYRFPKSHFAISGELTFMNGHTYTYQGNLLSGFGFTTYASAFFPIATLPSPFAGTSLFSQGLLAHVFIHLVAGPGINYLADNYWNQEKFRGSANFRTLLGMNANAGNGHYLFMEIGAHFTYLPTLHRRRWLVGPMLTVGILLF